MDIAFHSQCLLGTLLTKDSVSYKIHGHFGTVWGASIASIYRRVENDLQLIILKHCESSMMKMVYILLLLKLTIVLKILKHMNSYFAKQRETSF